MAFRQVARPTERFELSWPEGLSASPVAETDAPDIGSMLLAAGHPLRPECEAGTIEGATYYVTRLFDHHRHDRNYPLSLAASTVVRTEADHEVVGACLLGGGGSSGTEFGIYDIQICPAWQSRGIGTGTIRRALTVLHEHGIETLHLWRNDEDRAARLYERLGFQPTGLVE
jgi:GNAT superfamily N-acetyltransferase